MDGVHCFSKGIAPGIQPITLTIRTRSTGSVLQVTETFLSARTGMEHSAILVYADRAEVIVENQLSVLRPVVDEESLEPRIRLEFTGGVPVRGSRTRHSAQLYFVETDHIEKLECYSNVRTRRGIRTER